MKRVLLRIYSSTPKTKYAAVRSVLAAEDAEHFDLDFEDRVWVVSTSQKFAAHFGKIEQDFDKHKVLHGTSWMFHYKDKITIRFKIDRIYQITDNVVAAQDVFSSKDTSAWIRWMCENGALCTDHDVKLPEKIPLFSCSSSGAKSVKAKDCTAELEKYVASVINNKLNCK